MEGVTVGLKNSEFEDVFSTMTNGNGEYFLEAKPEYYPFMYAVKEYGENFLEYWRHDISLTDDIVISARINKLELYGLHCFKIRGAYPALTIYFRPMCHAKYKAGEEDIAPDLSPAMDQVSVNGRPVAVFLLNKVEEFAEDRNMTVSHASISAV